MTRVHRINKWWENVETLEPCILLGRMEDDVATVEKNSHIPQKLKLTYELAKLLGEAH